MKGKCPYLGLDRADMKEDHQETGNLRSIQEPQKSYAQPVMLPTLPP